MSTGDRRAPAPEPGASNGQNPITTAELFAMLMALESTSPDERDDPEGKRLAARLRTAAMEAGLHEIKRRAEAGDTDARIALRELDERPLQGAVANGAPVN